MRRILAVQLRSASLIARESGLNDEVRYTIQSLCAGPSPLRQSALLCSLKLQETNSAEARERSMELQMCIVSVLAEAAR